MIKETSFGELWNVIEKQYGTPKYSGQMGWGEGIICFSVTLPDGNEVEGCSVGDCSREEAVKNLADKLGITSVDDLLIY